MIFLELDQPPPTTTIANKQTNKQTWPTSLHRHHCPPGGDGPGCRGHQTDSEKGELALTIGVELTPRKKWKWKSEWRFSFDNWNLPQEIQTGVQLRRAQFQRERWTLSSFLVFSMGGRSEVKSLHAVSDVPGQAPFYRELYLFIPVYDSCLWLLGVSLIIGESASHKVSGSLVRSKQRLPAEIGLHSRN